MTTPTKPDTLCHAPGCDMPAWVNHPYCPRHVLAHDKAADIRVTSASEAALKVAQGSHEYVSMPYEKRGHAHACVALRD